MSGDATRRFALFACWICFTLAQSTSGEIGHDSSPCFRRSSKLICDYTNHKEVLYVDKNLLEEIADVDITGAKEVHIIDDICANVNLFNIENVFVLPAREHSCTQNISFVAKGCSINKIPIGLNQLSLDNSVLDLITSKTKLDSIIINISHVRMLDITGLQHLQVINSTIDNIQLSMSSESSLHLVNSNFSIPDQNAISLKGVTAFVENINIHFVSKERDYIHSKYIINFEGYIQRLDLSNDSQNIMYLSKCIDSKTSQLLSEETGCEICQKCISYLGGFIASIVLLIVTLCVTVPYIIYMRKLITHMESQLSNPDPYDYRKDSKFLDNLITQEKSSVTNEVQKEENHVLLDGIDTEKYQCVLENADSMKEMLTSTLQTEAMYHEKEVAVARNECQHEVEKLTNVSQEKITELEKSKEFELKTLDAQYEESFGVPTLLFWDKIKDVLEKAKLYNKELIDVKYANWTFDAEVRINEQKLKESVNVIRINKDFISKITISIKEYLNSWPTLVSVMDQTNINSKVVGKLFKLLENLITAHVTSTQANYDRQIREQDNKYLSDCDEQKEKLVKFCSDLKASVQEEKDHMLNQRSKDLESKLPQTNRYIKEIDNLYSIREELIDAKLELEMKKTRDKLSETQLKLLHLTVILQIQDEHMVSLQKMIDMSVEAIDICTRTLQLGAYEGSLEEFKGKRTRRPSSKFMDRYAQA